MLSNTSSIANVLNDVFIVHINSNLQDSIDWMYRKHPMTNQEGWSTKLDISDLPKGKHSLNIQRMDIGTERKGIFNVRWIPFWKD